MACANEEEITLPTVETPAPVAESLVAAVPDISPDGNAERPSASAPAPSKGRSRSPFGCFLLAYANYYNFTGRATRREYWFFILFFYVVVFALAIAEAIADNTPAYGIIREHCNFVYIV